MPSHSVKQAKTMSAIAHGWRPSGLDIPVKVAKEFHAADAGHKYGKGMDRRKKTRGGSVEGDGKDDVSYGGTLPRVLQPMTTQVPESWTHPPTNPYPRYADGGDVQPIPILPPVAPIAPLSPYEYYNVSAGQRKTVPPMKWHDDKKADGGSTRFSNFRRSNNIEDRRQEPHHRPILRTPQNGPPHLVDKTDIPLPSQLSDSMGTMTLDRNLDEQGLASGGKIDNFNPERGAAFGLARQGMIQSSVPGRTDKLNLNVPSGSYIIPADIPGAIGQGNSVAGGGILDRMFKKGPYGMDVTKSTGPRIGPRRSSLSRMHFAGGGQVGKVTPIVAAGGEYVVHPGTVAAMGHGDIELGHKILDAFVKHVRSKHITTLKGLKPPKGSK